MSKRYTKADNARRMIWEKLDTLAMNIHVAKDGHELMKAKKECYKDILYWAKLTPPEVNHET